MVKHDNSFSVGSLADFDHTHTVSMRDTWLSVVGKQGFSALYKANQYMVKPRQIRCKVEPLWPMQTTACRFHPVQDCELEILLVR